MPAQQQRRSDRVSIIVPVQVLGADRTGEFVEETQTLVISRHGATIVLNRDLAPEREVIIRARLTGKKAHARIVGQIGKRADAYVYGVAVLDSSINLWGIAFPPIQESEKAIARMLLECSSCQARMVTYLNELELEVFQANRNLTRYCTCCTTSTLWKQTLHAPSAKELPHQGKVEPASGSPPVQTPRINNERKEPRARVRVAACVRQPGFVQEEVVCEDISRGGLSFKSPKRYSEGSRIEIAVPYDPEAANIFIPALVVYARDLTGEGQVRHGVAYFRPRTGSR